MKAGLWGAVFLFAFEGCNGCGSGKVPEPVPSDSASAASASNDPAPPTSVKAKEAHERRIGLQPDLCNEAAKRFNELNGRDPFDKKAMTVITLCLKHGNLAWYRCVLEAKTVDDAKSCNQRLLGTDD
jgi:hypothetical protein